MAYFTSDFNDFWAELALNNEKSWFDKNRKRYETSVKKPWEAFVTELVERVREWEDIADLPAGKFISRINRDIRFSKDKTTYNTHVWAAIARDGKNTMLPGYYIGLGVDGIGMGGGMYHPEKDQLLSIRRHLVKNGDELHKLLGEAGFKKYWPSELSGEKNKVLPPEFKAAAEKEPLIFNKGWHYWRQYDVDEILRDDLADWVAKHFKAGAQVNDFFKTAL